MIDPFFVISLSFSFSSPIFCLRYLTRQTTSPDICLTIALAGLVLILLLDLKLSCFDLHFRFPEYLA